MLRPLVDPRTAALRRGSRRSAFVLFLLLAILLLSSAASVARAAQGWQETAVLPGSALSGVAMATALQGWTVNANVFVTADGGATWGTQTSGGWNLQDVTVTSVKGVVRGWAVGTDAGGKTGVVAGSTAEGVWTQRATFDGMALKAIDFADGSTGCAVGAGGAVVNTYDGGGKWSVQETDASWDLRGVAVLTNPILALASVTSPYTAFAVGTDAKTQSAVIVSRNSRGGWAQRVAFGVGAFNAVTFADATHGWAVGDGGLVAATIDGGATWTLQEPGGFWDLRGVSFSDANHGWVVGAGVILATADGGVTWKTQTTAAAWDLRDVAFSDALHGVAVGLDRDKSRAAVFTTSDGGAPAPAGPVVTSFSPASGAEGTLVTIIGTGFTGATSVTFNGAKAAFTVASATKITATVPAGATSGPIAVTTPAGTAKSKTSFTITAVPLPPPTVSAFSPASGPPGTVVTLTGTGFAKVSSVTFNGTPATSVSVVSVTQLLTAVPEGAGTGPISVTTPGGTGSSSGVFTVTTPTASGWEVQFSGTTQTLRAASATDVTHAWAVGDAGTVVASADGGKTWTAQGSSVRTALRDVVFVGAGAPGASGAAPARSSAGLHGWAVGAGGTIIASADGGATWKAQTSHLTTDLNGVSFADGLHGWAVGAGGAIVGTSDGGATWTRATSSGGQTLTDVSFADASSGCAVGEGGAILTTRDAGSSWGQVTSPSSEALSSVSFPSVSHGWAVGAGGTIIATRDGGASWRLQKSGTAADLRGVTFIDDLHGAVVGDGGLTLVTADGGARWDLQLTGSSSSLLGVVFPDPLHGWVVGGGGTILATTTGGWLPAPRIATLKPASGKRGAAVTITGFNFGATRGLGYVRFGGKKCSKYLSWSALSITCRVPAKVKIGKVKVSVTTPLGRSNRKTFRVLR